MEHQRNEEVLERIGKEIAQITHNKKDTQRKWIVHRVRGDSLLRKKENE